MIARDRAVEPSTGRPRGGARLLLVVVLAVVAGVAFWVLMSRQDPGPRFAAERGLTGPTEHFPPSPPAGDVLGRWASAWAERVRGSRVLGPAGYDEKMFIRELVALLQARGKSPLLRDSDEYAALSLASTREELAATPAVKALVAAGGRDGAIEALEPTLLLCDLAQDGSFLTADRGGVPESLARSVPRASGGDPLEIVLMRRRLRERLDDLAAVARAASKLPRPAADPGRQTVLAWAWSLDAGRLDESLRDPEPGSLPFFSLADLIAAERVVAGWPSKSLLRSPEDLSGRADDAVPFDPFARAPGWVSDGLNGLKAGAEQEVRELAADTGWDRKALDALLAAVSDLYVHEGDRELRVFRPDWHGTPPRPVGSD
jgi:hypothetical protein